MISPRERLAQALETAASTRPFKLAGIAKDAGVDIKVIANAARARPVSTISYLRIAAAIALDPLPELPHSGFPVADFDTAFFAMGFFIARGLKRHSQAEAATELGIKPLTIAKLEHGTELPIGVVLRACRYIGVHVAGYLRTSEKGRYIFLPKASVSRETLATPV